MTARALREVVRLHGMWARGEAGGARADLYGMDLGGADLSGVALSGANLSWANLSWANLGEAKRGASTIEALLLAGEVASYWTLIYGAIDGNVYMEYGCETSLQLGRRFGVCLKSIMGEGEPTKAEAQDGSDFFACLHTAADFGCVMFEVATEGGS